MYEGWPNLSDKWIANTEEFVKRAFVMSKNGNDVRCPCSRCRICHCQTRKVLSSHLIKYGFMPNYDVWVYHGEALPPQNAPEVPIPLEVETSPQVLSNDNGEYDIMNEMLRDLGEDMELPSETEDPPTSEAKNFFELLKASEEPLHEHIKVTVLAFMTRLMAIKSKFTLSHNCYNMILSLIGDILPANHKMPKDVYQSRKLLSGLGMDYKKIDVCPNNCMLFWKNDIDLKKCRKCQESRFVEVVNEDGEKVTTEIAQKQLRYMPLMPRLK
jgi:hypothetical protein